VRSPRVPPGRVDAPTGPGNRAIPVPGVTGCRSVTGRSGATQRASDAPRDGCGGCEECDGWAAFPRFEAFLHDVVGDRGRAGERGPQGDGGTSRRANASDPNASGDGTTPVRGVTGVVG